jgi:predicted nucleic acid-binding protein
MATTSVESSALVKRYVAEAGSAWVRRTIARPVHQVLYTAALTEVEVRSALQRLVREGRLDTAQAQRLTQRVTSWLRSRPSPGEAWRKHDSCLPVYDAASVAISGV